MWQKQDEDVRSDDEVQRAVMSQFLGIVPERGKELEQLWSDNNLLFSLLADGNEIRMEGGLYRHVRFNHRTLRVLWVASFAAWEAYRALVIAIESGRTPAFTRLNELLDCAVSIRDSATPINVPLPQGIPEPGSFVDGATFPELRAASELAVFVSGWAMLHEVRHVLHQREGTSTSEDDEPSKRREEELSCDAFATKFIMDKIDQYASTTGQNFASVVLKRKIVFSLRCSHWQFCPKTGGRRLIITHRCKPA